MERLLRLSELDIDYSQHHAGLQNLAKLAASIAGTSISLINLIDSLTQWTISNYGLDINQMMREDSVCQYTIQQQDGYEVTDLSDDERFKDKFYVTGTPGARYYYGLPLRTSSGSAIGALCVLDTERRELSPQQIDMLKLIADEIVSRLKTFRIVENLKKRLLESRQSQLKLSHDIRGPLGGVVGLAKIITDQGSDSEMDEVLEFMTLIHSSGQSVIDMADELLGREDERLTTFTQPKKPREGFNLATLRDKILMLYGPQARQKHIDMSVSTSALTDSIPIASNKLLQIAGNLISNAIKFTPAFGHLDVDLNLIIDPSRPVLKITVLDSGQGMDHAQIEKIFSGNAKSMLGTDGEQGYGFGLSLVRHLVDSLGGHIDVFSKPGSGTRFEVVIPQNIYGS